jgi:hypothetical protein
MRLGMSLTCLLCVLQTVLFCSPASAWEGQTERTEHFQFFFRPQDRSSAKSLLAVAEREYERVGDIIGHHPRGRIDVYLAGDAGEFRLLTGGQIPEWGIGAAVPRQRRIVLISPRHAKGDASPRQVLAHELSHVILGQALGQVRAPRWLDEGLAMYISHEWKLGRSVVVARALLFDSLIPLQDIAAVNTYGQARASLAYAESFLAVAFIVDRFGDSALRELVRELARSGDIDLAMGISLGVTYREFQLIWRDYVTRRFNWAAVVSNPLVLWTLMLALFLLAYFLKRRHTRRTMERWRLNEEGVDPSPLPDPFSHRWPEQ